MDKVSELQSSGEELVLAEVKNYIDGVDELAEKLGVEPTGGMGGINIMGKSGKWYSLTEMLTAHVDMMTRTLGDKNE